MPTLRNALILLSLLLCVPGLAVGQPKPAETAPAGQGRGTSRTEIVQLSDLDARATREQLREIMQRLPPDLGRILKMDPTLLSSEQYLSQYPALASFVASHPEIAHNPSYFLEFVYLNRDEFPSDPRREAMIMWRNMVEAFGVFCIFLTVAGLIAWFVKMFIDYRRWLRLSKVQTEVHNKLLERFSGTGDLLAYIQSPAGRRFLESAPIPLDPGPRSVAAPFGRILWAVQVGVVLTVVGAGFQLVSGRVIDDIAQPMSLFGVLFMSLGLGFIASGAVSYLMSRRLGLLDPVAIPPPAERQDSSLV